MPTPSSECGVGGEEAADLSVGNKDELGNVKIEKANFYSVFPSDAPASPSIDESREDVVEDSNGGPAETAAGASRGAKWGGFVGSRMHDFDVDPTEMYRCIHNRSWDEVVLWCELRPEQASQWVSRYKADGTLRWRILPLHGALLLRAPESVVSALLAAYPEGASCKDDQGNYPLHLTLKAPLFVNCVQLLLAAWPDCIDVPDETGCVPLILAKRVQGPQGGEYVRAILQSLLYIRGEVDFDTNPTMLYRYLQQKDWERDVDDLVSRKDASVYVCRREANGTIRWRMLPLMAAFVFKAPEAVTEKILKAYPEAAGCEDDRKMLPIHAALRNGAPEMLIVSLLHACPCCIDQPDIRGRTPMDCAKLSKSPLRDSYIEALELGSDVYQLTKECDSQTNPTDLYLAISQSRWSDALTAATEYPDQARTWVSQKGRGGDLKWRMLPAHACILFKAPKNVLAKVVQAYPDAALCKDHVGMLPIHHALQHMAEIDVVVELIIANPGCLIAGDREGRTPIMLAEASNSPHRSEYIKLLGSEET